MKVCDVVINSIWHDPRVIKQIAEYSKQKDIELYAVGKQCDRYDINEINKIPAHVEIVPMHCKLLKSIFINIRDFYKVAKAIVRTNADIIHANDLNALVPAYIASKKLHCKVIYDTHEVFLQNNWLYSNPILKCFWTFFEKRIIKKVDLVVCVSNAAADYFADHYHIPRPMVVTNCVDKLDDSALGQPKHEHFEILLHGQFYKGRGCDLMVQAAKITPDNEIVYALRGYGKMENELRRYVSEHKLSNVVFYPPVKTWELTSSAVTSKVGVAITVPYCLNFKLSVSNKIFEYLAAGLPVIMSDIPEHRYLNDKYHFGLIMEENTPESLMQCAMQLYEDEELFRTCSKNALILSREINWENEFKKLLEFERNIYNAQVSI